MTESLYEYTFIKDKFNKNLSFFFAYMSNLSNEKEILQKTNNIENNIIKLIKYNISIKKDLIIKKCNVNINLEKIICKNDESQKIDINFYENLYLKFKDLKEKLKNEQNKKLTVFNLINKQRRLINKRHEEIICKYLSKYKQIKNIYHELRLLFRLLKLRIIELNNKESNKDKDIYIGYMFNLNTKDFRIIDLNKCLNNNGKCYLFWRSMKDIWIDNRL